MSRRSSTSAKGGGKKAKAHAADPDVYVAMLFVSVTALTFGIVFLVYECRNYQWMIGR